MAPPPSSIAEAQLKDLKSPTKPPVAGSSLWKDSPVLILVLRRPGCVFCRAEAQHLWAQKATFEEMGVKMICVVHEWLPAEIEAFQPAYWGGPLYLDEKKEFYKLVNGGQIRRGSVFQLLYGMLNPFSQLKKRYDNAKKAVKDSNTTGDGLTMGGLVVVRKGNGGVEYTFAEKSFGEHAAESEIVEACKKAAAASK